MFKGQIWSVWIAGLAVPIAVAQATENVSEKAAVVKKRVVVRSADGKHKSDRQNARVNWAATAPHDIQNLEWVVAEPDRAWIGVHVVAVPKAVAAQLQLESQGQMVINVAKDTPADKAGIDRYDVLLRFDGRSVPADQKEFVELIQKAGDGAKVDVELIRAGKPMHVELELTKRPAPPEIEFKFELEPDMVGEEEVRTRGKMVFKGPGGDWHVKDFREMAELPNLPKLPVIRPKDVHVWPQMGDFTMKIEVEDDNKEVKVVVDEDGERVEIHRRKDGRFVVTRSQTSDDGSTTEETEREYKNEDALRASDEKAFALFKRSRQGWEAEPTLRFRPRVEMPKRHVPQPDMTRWLDQVEKRLQTVQKQLAESQKQLSERMDEARRRLESNTEEEHEEIVHFEAKDDRQAARQSVRFSSDENGRIEVRIHSGDDELSLTFSDESELEKRRPKLFAKYRELIEKLER